MKTVNSDEIKRPIDGKPECRTKKRDLTLLIFPVMEIRVQRAKPLIAVIALIALIPTQNRADYPNACDSRRGDFWLDGDVCRKGGFETRPYPLAPNL